MITDSSVAASRTSFSAPELPPLLRPSVHVPRPVEDCSVKRCPISISSHGRGTELQWSWSLRDSMGTIAHTKPEKRLTSTSIARLLHFRSIQKLQAEDWLMLFLAV